MQTKAVLSKSTYIKGLQCTKALYLHKHYYKLKDPIPKETQALFNRGHDIGRLAQKLFPNGIDVSPKSPREYSGAVIKTHELIQQKYPVIYEAAFIANNTLIYLDILVCKGDYYEAYEVKSSLKISGTYIEDAALQLHVLRNSGLNIKSINLVTINGEYRLDDSFDITNYFKITDVTDRCAAKEEDIKDRIQKLVDVVNQPLIPQVNIGTRCEIPYSCDFKGTCWKNIPTPSIFHLNNMPNDELKKLEEQGISQINQIINYSSWPKDSKIILDSILKNQTFVDKTALNIFLTKVQYPLLLIDIETYQPVIPKIKGEQAFQSKAFAFSYIVLKNNSEIIEQNTLISEGSQKDENILASSLANLFTKYNNVMVYDAGSERKLIHSMLLLADNTDIYKSLTIIDLREPFEKFYYHNPKQLGSISLKNVAHALCTSINYEALVIKNGRQAMNAYEDYLNSNDLFKRMEIKQELINYSEMDVKALMEILRVIS